jgi:hypothetical protein
MKTLFAILPFFAATSAQALDWEGVFEGTLGKSKIIVELNAGPEKSAYKGGDVETSRYSYFPKPYDLNLIRSSEGEILTFTELNTRRWETEPLEAGDPRITGHWSLTVTAEGATGTWQSPDGKKDLPIALHRVALANPSPLPENQSQLSYTYNQTWLTGVQFTEGKSSPRFGGIDLRYETDGVFGLSYPVFERFPDAQRKDLANTMLRQRHRDAVMTYRDCKNSVPVEYRPKNPEPEITYDVTYASPTLLSIEESGSLDCGGAHPANYVNPMTFDLVTQKQIGGGDQLDHSDQGFGAIFKLTTKDERIAFERIAWGAWMANAAKVKEDEAQCMTIGFENEKPEGEKEFSLSFTAKGLAVRRTDYPSVAAVCLWQDYNPTIIPWAALKPMLKPGQTLLVDEVR